MADIKQCEYEIIPPDNDPIPEIDPEELVHPDKDLTTELAFDEWLKRPRRFVFFMVNRRMFRPRRVSMLYHGFAHRDGSVLIVQNNGHPMGWYSSVASAWRRLKLDGVGLYLAWMEPDPGDISMSRRVRAEQEVTASEPSTWYVSVPYRAYGAVDAQLRAAQVIAHLESCVPGVDRLDVTYGAAEDPDTESHVFCDEPNCLREPGHDGPHLLASLREFELTTARSSYNGQYDEQLPADADARAESDPADGGSSSDADPE